MQGVTTLEFIFLIDLFLAWSFHEYVTYQYNHIVDRHLKVHQMKQGFDIFTLFQIIASGIGLVSIFGWLYGMIFLAISITALQYLCHFTVGLIIAQTAKINQDIPLMLFIVNVWVLIILSVILLIS